MKGDCMGKVGVARGGLLNAEAQRTQSRAEILKSFSANLCVLCASAMSPSIPTASTPREACR